jgi:hypothetical protein
MKLTFKQAKSGLRVGHVGWIVHIEVRLPIIGLAIVIEEDVR